jgi:long-chain acyl-CoA synthetase
VRAADLTSFLSDRLAPFKMPLRYDPIETIPRNPSGKILRRTLRDPFWSGRARAVN